MMIESAIFNTPVLAIAYNDGYHVTSPHNAYKHYEHYTGIEKIPGFTLCHRKAEFGRIFREVCNVCIKQGKNLEMKKNLNYYLYFDKKTYAERLRGAIEQIALREGWGI